MFKDYAAGSTTFTVGSHAIFIMQWIISGLALFGVVNLPPEKLDLYTINCGYALPWVIITYIFFGAGNLPYVIKCLREYRKQVTISKDLVYSDEDINAYTRFLENVRSQVEYKAKVFAGVFNIILCLGLIGILFYLRIDYTNTILPEDQEVFWLKYFITFIGFYFVRAMTIGFCVGLRDELKDASSKYNQFSYF